jgi:DNA-binding transcriptional MocR family regulator
MSARQVSVQLPPPLREKLQAYAAAHDLTVPDVMRQALTAFLDAQSNAFSIQLIQTLQSPEHWPTIYQVLQAQIAATVATLPPPAPPPPRPTWSHPRDPTRPPRTPPVTDGEPKPF